MILNLKNIQIFVFQGWLQLFLGLITRSAVDYTPEFLWRHQVWLHKPCDYIYNRRTHAHTQYYMNMSSHLPRDSSTTELSPSKGEIWWTKTPLNSQLLKWFSRPKLFACQKIYYSQNKLCTLVSNHSSVLFTEWCNSK